jgi:hypothetical protein
MLLPSRGSARQKSRLFWPFAIHREALFPLIRGVCRIGAATCTAPQSHKRDSPQGKSRYGGWRVVPTILQPADFRPGNYQFQKNAPK